MDATSKEMNRILRTTNGAGEGKYVGITIDDAADGGCRRDAIVKMLSMDKIEGSISENIAHIRMTETGRTTFQVMLRRYGPEMWMEWEIDPARPT